MVNLCHNRTLLYMTRNFACSNTIMVDEKVDMCAIFSLSICSSFVVCVLVHICVCVCVRARLCAGVTVFGQINEWMGACFLCAMNKTVLFHQNTFYLKVSNLKKVKLTKITTIKITTKATTAKWGALSVVIYLDIHINSMKRIKI